MNVTIDIAIEDDRWTSVGDVEALARRAIEAARIQADATIPSDADLSIVLCDDAFIQGLNKKWRGKDKPTNVLSFPTEEPALLGDIIVAYETSAREADAEGKSLADHLTHLMVHGFLHLVGLDHEDDKDADAMERLEVRALLTIGIASPYEVKTPTSEKDERTGP